MSEYITKKITYPRNGKLVQQYQPPQGFKTIDTMKINCPVDNLSIKYDDGKKLKAIEIRYVDTKQTPVICEITGQAV
jgi:hypothetical protein